MTKRLNTIDAVIDWLGGPTKAAEWLGCTDNSIHHWRRRGIPPGHHLRLVLRGLRQGVEISRDLIEVPGEEGEELARLFRRLPKQLETTA